ncbi:MAG: S9 family peptidase [Bacteroidaceae bacterium]|nr:S9 family peptidase [Bacteroidaceae bacterium]
MKRDILTITALLIMTVANAQEERRLLTMEEAVLGTGIRTESRNYRWQEEGSTYTYSDENTIYVIDAKNGKTISETAIPKEEEQKEESKPYAYSEKGNVYYTDQDGNAQAITSYNEPGIVCGETVSRNEFGISGGIFVSPDKRRIAFYKKDESKITLFPLLDITSRTGTLQETRYPMNGMTSEIITLGVFDTETKQTIWLDVTDFTEERYLTNITWNPDGDKIYIQVLDRNQKNMNLNVYSAIDGSFIKTLFSDSDNRYIEPQYPIYFMENNPEQFIYATNVRDGYWNLYLHGTDGKFIKNLTPVKADVEYAAQSGNYIYYYSAEVSPIDRHLFRTNIKSGKTERITKESGWHTCSLSPDGKYILDRYSAHNIPNNINILSADGKKSTNIFSAPDPTADLNFIPIEQGTIKSADGKYDNYYRLIKPLDFDPSKKYPVILYVYGGPHNQLVTNTFQYQLRRWEMYMAQRGYVVFVMDNRGTPNRGAEYEKAIHKQCGKAEMEDQIKGMEWLMANEWVDTERIGVHGWSYGGFMTISLMVNYPEIFKVGVAGGPVIDWKWYEVMYGERYMETEATNKEGFEQTSLIPRAKDLKGKLLICQGAIDDVVLWQHSLNFVEACIKEGVQLDYFPYPTHLHNVTGKDRIHLMNKVTDYFNDWLK